MAWLVSARANPIYSSHNLRRSPLPRPMASRALEIPYKHPAIALRPSKSLSLVTASLQPSKTISAGQFDVLNIWRSAGAVCFDVDSTVCLDEGIDELADFCGAGKAVAEWTTK
ncbi:hypothetical protein BHM03_00020240 [Ensete ventricosum]|nr:hypothetical protein BHM03_00020240 [Ensete ventricosum]